jgi:hypothetical protein
LLNIIIKISSCYNKDNKNHIYILAITDNEKAETYEALGKVKRIKRGMKQMRGAVVKGRRRFEERQTKNRQKKRIRGNKRGKRIEEEETHE